MFLALGIVVFIIGCCLSSYEDISYKSECSAEQRHRELIQALEEARKKTDSPVIRKTRHVRRRFAQDKNGNILGEEITEEELCDDE